MALSVLAISCQSSFRKCPPHNLSTLAKFLTFQDCPLKELFGRIIIDPYFCLDTCFLEIRFHSQHQLRGLIAWPGCHDQSWEYGFNRGLLQLQIKGLPALEKMLEKLAGHEQGSLLQSCSVKPFQAQFQLKCTGRGAYTGCHHWLMSYWPCQLVFCCVCNALN